MKPKLCYVIPEHRASSPTHFAYLIDFVEHSREHFDIFLIVEKSNAPIFPTSSIRVYQQKLRWLPFRFLENAVIIKYARLCGYRDFYVHYSFLSAFNASLVVRALGGRVFYWNCGLPWNYPQSTIRSFFERCVYTLITYLVTGTEGLKKEYAKQYHLSLEKIKVMPNWIDVESIKHQASRVNKEELKKQLKIEQSSKILLFVHRLSKRKGVHYIPEILKQLEGENIVLLVVGDGPERKTLELQITNYKLQTRVRFFGNIPQSEIVSYFSVSDIFVMPSEEEGFPHVLLEAMASGTPFVAFDVGGVGEMTPPETHKLLYSKGDIVDFVQGIRSLLSSTTFRAHLGSIEQNWVLRYDTNNVTKRFYELFEK